MTLLKSPYIWSFKEPSFGIGSSRFGEAVLSLNLTHPNLVWSFALWIWRSIQISWQGYVHWYPTVRESLYYNSWDCYCSKRLFILCMYWWTVVKMRITKYIYWLREICRQHLGHLIKTTFISFIFNTEWLHDVILYNSNKGFLDKEFNKFVLNFAKCSHFTTHKYINEILNYFNRILFK